MKRRRQNKAPGKARFNLKWDERNYDYLIRRAQEEDKSIAALANEIVRKERQTAPRGTIETS